MIRLAAILILTAFALSGCKDAGTAMRTYHEYTTSPRVKSLPPSHPPVEPGSSGMPAAAMRPSRSSHEWTAPEGWQEKPGGGMRAASFVTPGGAAGDCSIVILEGDAGGVSANIDRWLKQIDISLGPSELASFMESLSSFATEAGANALLVDPRPLQAGDSGDSPSMLAAILSEQGKTVFIKLTGSLNVMDAEEARFMELCRSIR